MKAIRYTTKERNENTTHTFLCHDSKLGIKRDNSQDIIQHKGTEGVMCLRFLPVLKSVLSCSFLLYVTLSSSPTYFVSSFPDSLALYPACSFPLSACWLTSTIPSSHALPSSSKQVLWPVQVSSAWPVHSWFTLVTLVHPCLNSSLSHPAILLPVLHTILS